MGRNGRRHILNHFSRERSAGHYINVIQDLLGVVQVEGVAA
jgi:hypothetical protein